MLSKAYEEIIGGSSNGIQYTSCVSAKYFDIGDIDNDGDLDLWVESSGGKISQIIFFEMMETNSQLLLYRG